MKARPGGGRRDDTCDHGVSRIAEGKTSYELDSKVKGRTNENIKLCTRCIGVGGRGGGAHSPCLILFRPCIPFEKAMGGWNGGGKNVSSVKP